LDKEAAYGTRFLWSPVFVGVGALCYFQLDFEPSLSKLLALTILAALLAYLLRWVPILAPISLFFLTIVSGSLFAKIETSRLDTHIITNQMILPITARLLAWEERQQGDHRLIVRILTAQRAGAELVGKKMRLTARSLPPGMKIGIGLEGLVSLRPPSGPLRPGAYDFGFHQFYRGISGQGFFMGQPSHVEVPAPESSLERLNLEITTLRMKIGWRIEAVLQGEVGAIASALITGQRGGISEETNQALRLSGLAHILSISGLHMAMVTGMVLLIGRAILGLFVQFSSRHAPKKIAAFIALGFSSFYLLLSGAEIAAQRSFIMVAVMLLAVLFDRSALTMRNLSLSALVILTLTPHEIVSPSFQMSFAATGALIAVFGWWSRSQADRTRAHKQGLIWRLLVLPPLSSVVVTLVAGSASGLYAAYHFANIAPLGFIGNVAALPVMSFLIMFPALLACMLMPFGLEALPLEIMALGIEWIRMIGFWVASITPEIHPGMITPMSLGFFSLALVILLLMHSPLRLLAVLPFLAGIMLYVGAPRPLMLIDEESRLIALATEADKLALSRARPNAFILSQWLPVFKVRFEDLILPDKGEAAGGFFCTGLTCQATMPSGEIFATALGKAGRDMACHVGDVVLLDYLSHEQETCPQNKYVITRYELVRAGAAMLYATPANGYQIKWAQGTSLRPWNAHRYHSKAAMGIP